MNSIRLHKTKGLNVHMTVCPRCGEESNELAMLGAADKVYKCSECDAQTLGYNKNICPNCGTKNTMKYMGELGEYERICASEPCSACKIEIALHKEEVAKGGVYWRCNDCGSEGVIKDSPFARLMRKVYGLTNGEPCGVEFSAADHCPVCGESNE